MSDVLDRLTTALTDRYRGVLLIRRRNHMTTGAYLAMLLLPLSLSPAAAQIEVNPVDEVSCFAVSEDGQLLADSVSHVRLILTGGDSLVLTWEPAIGIGTLGMESESGTDIWWVKGSLQPPITVGTDPPGAQDSERFSRSALRPGARFQVIVMDAADEEEVTWACMRLFEVQTRH